MAAFDTNADKIASGASNNTKHCYKKAYEPKWQVLQILLSYGYATSSEVHWHSTITTIVTYSDDTTTVLSVVQRGNDTNDWPFREYYLYRH